MLSTFCYDNNNNNLTIDYVAADFQQILTLLYHKMHSLTLYSII